MGHLITHRYSRAFALPVVMISSVVMMMVLLSGLTAASSVNVGLRAQYEDKMMQSAAAAGITMAKNCIARNDNTITWANDKPLKPNTNCKGVEQFSCPSTSPDERCYLVKSGTYRSKFSVGVNTSSSNGTTLNSQATLHQMRRTTNAVLKQLTQSKRVAVSNDVVVTTGAGLGLNGIVRGDSFACGIDISGKVHCWGMNNYGQLGNGTTTNSSTPVAVSQGEIPTGVTMVSLSAGFFYVCGVASNGAIYCWGLNNVGQLGIGSTSPSQSATPVEVAQAPEGSAIPAGVSIRDISAGGSHTCVATSNGKVYCWGYGIYGQLGNNSATSSPLPVAVSAGTVPPNSNLIKVSAGSQHSCAISDTGQAYCWGLNSSGQHGAGNATYNSVVPVSVALPSGVTLRAISASSSSTTCGLDFSNKAYCWGANGSGQLGNGTSGGSSSSPVAVSQGAIPPTAVIQDIAVGTSHVCVTTSGSKAYCWGLNSSGQLGIGSTTPSQSTTPVAVTLSAGVKIQDLAVGGTGTCAIKSDATAMCWGANNQSQLGNGTTGGNSSTPVSVSGGNSQMPLGIRAIDVGGAWGADTACAINTEERLYCWGNNAGGQFGNGNTTNSSTPVAAFMSTLMWVDIPVKSVSVGGLSACVMAWEKLATCMGYNGYGQLGNGTTTDSLTPVNILQGDRPPGVGIETIKTKGYTTCGVGSDGKAYCWGQNNYGQLGNGTTTNSSTPVAVSQGQIPAGVTIKDVAPYGANTCALGSNGKVYCWGYNAQGQLGNSSTTNSSTPVAVAQGAIPNGVTAKSIEGNCILGSDEWVYCWGQNNVGQLGDSTNTNRTAPVAILRAMITPSSVTIKAMSSGEGGHRCVVGSNGKAYCWGDDSSSQLGAGGLGQMPLPWPVSSGAIPTGVTITSIATGPASTCATASNLRVYCWGANGAGQLGNGNTTNQYYPAATLQRLAFRSSGSKIGSSVSGSSVLFAY